MSNFRIKTNISDTNRYINVNLQQNFDFLEILSLKLSQEEVYKRYNADYGSIVGRCFMNGGVGIPNVKVSIFIKIDSQDRLDFNVNSMYPYETPQSRNSDGIRYNLLPNESGELCYTPVGSFPSKNIILDNPELNKIYDKYYKFSTVTNNAGDFMFFGVPVGSHTIIVDADLSDIGIFSQRPYDFIEVGSNPNQFESSTKFKSGTNIDTLSQIKSKILSVNVLPFWGDTNTTEIGINRLDIDLGYELKPTAIFMGSIFGDNEKNSVNKNCQPRKKLGYLCETIATEGLIEMIRETRDGQIERVNIDGGRLIDENGAWAYRIPMNLDYVTTNENGELTPTDDITKGIPTRANVRFKISMDESGDVGRIRTRAKYLVPHNPKNISEEDYSFGDETSSKHFRNLYWNKIYTVRNYISRVQGACGANCADNRRMIGIKDVDDCVGTKNPFPYNKIDGDFNPLFSIICIIIGIILFILTLLNGILSFIYNVRILRFRPFRSVKCIGVTCNSQTYSPGCSGRKPSGTVSTSRDQTHECYKIEVAEALNVFEFDFYNDWVNGTLYSFLLKYKKKKNSKAKFCDLDSQESMYIVNTIYRDSTTTIGLREQTNKRIGSGIIKEYDGELFYGAFHKSGYQLFPTDLYELGAVFECDWQGKPKINDLLVPTTYLIPPKLNEEEGVSEFANDGSPNGVLFNFSCIKMDMTGDQITNVSRICEIGVGLDENRDTTVADRKINNNEIENKYVRDILLLLNKSGLDPNNSITSNFETTNSDYLEYRNIPNNNNLRQVKGNSLYFYFGSEPGLTALDKMNSKYFTKCIQTGTAAFTVIGDVTNVTTIGGVDGSIDVSVIGGTAPFTYEWNNGATSEDLSNLPAGEYILIVTDFNGNRVRKLFTVNEPKPLEFSVIGTNLTSLTTDNGIIEVEFILGGIPLYNISLSGPNGVINVNNVNIDGFTFNNLPVGNYTITVTDSSSPSLSVTQNLELLPPKVLQCSVSKENSFCFGESSGTININIQSGNPPYTFLTTSNDAVMVVVDELGFETIVPFSGDTQDLNGLGVGTYNILVTDVSDQTCSSSVTISGPNKPSILRHYPKIGSPNYFRVFSENITPDNYGDVIMYLNDISVGSPTYVVPSSLFSTEVPKGYYFNYENLTVGDLTGVSLQPNDVIHFEDSNGCISNKITIPVPTNNLILSTVSFGFTNKFKLTNVLVGVTYKLYNNKDFVENKTWSGTGSPEIMFNTTEGSLNNGFAYVIADSNNNFDEDIRRSNTLNI